MKHLGLLLVLMLASVASSAAQSTPCPGPIGTLCINITWTETGAPTGTTYNIFRGIGPGNESVTPYATGVPNTMFQDINVVAGNNYCYKAVAHDSGGSSAASNESCALPNPPPVPQTVVAAIP